MSSDRLDPKTTGPTIKVEIEHTRNGGRADFIVPLQAERRHGGYRAVSHRVARSKPHGIDVYEVVMEETGEPKSFVGPYEANDCGRGYGRSLRRRPIG